MLLTILALIFSRFRERVDWSPAYRDITILAAVWLGYFILKTIASHSFFQRIFHLYIGYLKINFGRQKPVHAISEIDICEIGFRGITICEMGFCEIAICGIGFFEITIREIKIRHKISNFINPELIYNLRGTLIFIPSLPLSQLRPCSNSLTHFKPI